MLRYQEMLGVKRPKSNNVHVSNIFIWNPALHSVPGYSAVRMNYYTSAVGTHDKIDALKKDISKIIIQRTREVHGQMCPHVFKKEAKSKKTKIVDISICIDALRHSHHGHADAIYLLSGDGDYLPLIEEVMRNGTQVWLGAFSSGLNPKLPAAVDRFVDLDPIFFEKD